MSAAFALTATKEAQDRYDVTVYQMGWRLGGKGASGRRAGEGQRIEEHGLHVWSGFYDNAIRQMKDALGELKDTGATGTFLSFDEAFTPHNNIALGDDTGPEWSFWPVAPAMNNAEPGSDGVILTPAEYLRELTGFLREAMTRGGVAKDEPHGLPSHVHQHVRSRIDDADISGPLHFLHRFLHWRGSNDANLDRMDHVALTGMAEAAQGSLRGAAKRTEADKGAGWRHLYQVLDLGGAAIRGMIADGVLTHGFDHIDDLEISDWLQRHGAHPDTVAGPLVKSVYDYAFGFRHGKADRAHREIAAGVFLKGTMRLLLT